MNALQRIEAELRQLGYASEAILRGYTFADVLSATGEPRRVELAAFTQLPESYRSAAFGVVVEEEPGDGPAGLEESGQFHRGEAKRAASGGR